LSVVYQNDWGMSIAFMALEGPPDTCRYHHSGGDVCGGRRKSFDGRTFCRPSSLQNDLDRHPGPAAMGPARTDQTTGCQPAFLTSRGRGEQRVAVAGVARLPRGNGENPEVLRLRLRLVRNAGWNRCRPDRTRTPRDRTVAWRQVLLFSSASVPHPWPNAKAADAREATNTAKTPCFIGFSAV